MRLNVNHVAEIYVTEQRQRVRVKKSYQKQTNVLWRFWRNGTQLYFVILTWLGAPKRRHTGKQMMIARPILTTSRLLEQFWREAAKSDDYSHNVQPYRFEPYHALPDGVDSAIAADDAN